MNDPAGNNADGPGLSAVLTTWAKKIFSLFMRLPLFARVFIVGFTVIFLLGYFSLNYELKMNVRGEIYTHQVEFNVRSENNSPAVTLLPLTQIHLLEAKLVGFSKLDFFSAKVDTSLSTKNRRASFSFSSNREDSPLTWIDSFELPDGGFARVIVGQNYPDNIRVRVSNPSDLGRMSFIMHHDSSPAIQEERGGKIKNDPRLTQAMSVTAAPINNLELRGRLAPIEPGFNITDGIPVSQLGFLSTNTDESPRRKSAIFWGRVEFDEDWLNPDRRGEPGRPPGFDLEAGDYLHVEGKNLVIDDLEFVKDLPGAKCERCQKEFVNDLRLHCSPDSLNARPFLMKIRFSGKAKVLQTRGNEGFKDAKISLYEYLFLHPAWVLFFKLLSVTIGILGGLLGVSWIFDRNQEGGPDTGSPDTS